MTKPQTSSELLEAAELLGQLVAESRIGGASRGERLQRALSQMCSRGRLRAAAVIDDQGLPLAVYGDRFRGEVLGALSSIFGHALAQAEKILGSEGMVHISADLEGGEKVAVRPFATGGSGYCLVAVCPLGIDERGEMELSVEQLSAIVRGGIS